MMKPLSQHYGNLGTVAVDVEAAFFCGADADVRLQLNHQPLQQSLLITSSLP